MSQFRAHVENGFCNSDQKSMLMVGFLTRNDSDILRAKTGPYKRIGYQTNIPPTPADPIFLPLLMYDVCENHLKIMCMMRLLGLLNHVCNLSILMLELLSILIGTRQISVIIARYILTLFRAGIRH